MKIRGIGRFLLPIVALGFLSSTATVLRASPFAGEVTNNNGTIQFYINESGGNVTVTYNDGTTNANFNGITTGTNEPFGTYSFPLGSHTSYSIAIYKLGSGIPSVIQTVSESGATVNPRGVDVNKNVGSPYFGRIYWADGDGTGNTPGVFMLNPDFSFVGGINAPLTAGVPIYTAAFSATDVITTGTSPWRLSVATNDFVIVGNASEYGAGVYLMDPACLTNQLLLGPLGSAKYGKHYANYLSHGTIESRPLITGSLAGGNLVMYQIDGELSPYNSIEIYDWTNSAAPWTNPPTYTASEVGLNFDSLALGGNEYPGLTIGSNGLIYASTQRDNLSNPTMQVYDPTGLTNLWNSWLPAGTSYPGGAPASDSMYFNGDNALIDSVVTPDCAYIFGAEIHNYILICPLTNGIPNLAGLVTLADPLGTTETCRGVASDAADNLYESSSGLGTLQEWTLGLTTTTVTTGNASGVTGFQIIYPPYSGSVTASNSVISQPNSHGNPTSTAFVIQLASPATNTFTENYSFSGTALGVTNGGVAYPATFTANPPASVTFVAGQSQAVVTVTAVTDSIPRPTTTLTMTLGVSSTFLPIVPENASINILNTAPQELFTAVGAPSMYNAFSNDYCYITITRWGDLNAASYQVNTFSLGGTAVENTDYTAPNSVTFGPGALTENTYIYPRTNGQLPIHTNNLPFVGDKTVILTLESSGGYTAAPNTNDFTILDSAYPPATVLYYDPLTNSAPTNWNVTATDANYPVNSPNYAVGFGYNLQGGGLYDPATVPIPNPPSGAQTALYASTSQNSYSGAVNLYPTNVNFSGNYAVRFSMDVTEPNTFATSGSFEGPIFGINCSGIQTNWWYWYSVSGPSPSASAQTDWNWDGLWFWVSDSGYSGGAYGEYDLFTGATNIPPNTAATVTAVESTFAQNFKGVDFTCAEGPGVPCNGSPDNEANISSWADVEMRQYNGVVTLSIDKTPIIVYANTTSFTNGEIMLGYANPVFGPDAGDGGVSYSGLTVVQLGPPRITGISYNSTNSTFSFNFTITDDTALTVVGAASINGPYTTVAGATITSLGGGAYRATVPVSGPTQFYRVNQQF